MNSAVEIGSKWIRHRGGKMPVKKGVAIEVKHRDGDLYEDEAGGTFSRDWSHTGGGGDIMQYRIIKQLKVEEVEYRGPFPSAPIGDYANVIEYDIEFPSGVCSVEAKTDQIDGPIKWRDQIAELEAHEEDIQREIAILHARLTSEGFQLIRQYPSSSTDSPAVDMSDWRNWQEGDIVTIVERFDGYDVGDEVTFDHHDFDDDDHPINVLGDAGLSSWPKPHQVRFLRRP